MRKILLTASVAMSMVLGATNSAEAQAVEQGDMITTAQYGFPNLWNLVIKSAYNSSEYTGFSIKGFGPVGVQFEFMVTDKISLGVKSNYSGTSISYIENQEVYNPNTGTYTTSPYNYKLSFNRIRALGRFALHFGNSDKFDGYFGIAAGYSSFSIKYETNDPNYDGDVAFKNPVPVGFRLDVGGTYFIVPKFGLNFEIGLGGGPLINAGIATKF
jgi:hypothetical protein